MPLQPHQFKTIKQFFETLRTEWGSLRDTIQKSCAAITDQGVAKDKSEREDREKISHAIDNLTNQQEHGDDTSETNQDRRHGDDLTVQWVLAIATILAFIAAAIYAFEAHEQLQTMNNTYGEIQKQTKAAQDSAYVSCLNAQAAQATFFQIQRDAADSHTVAVGTVKQTAAGIESERAIMTLQPRFPTAQDESLSEQLRVPFTLRNEGKSEALAVSAWYKATLVSEKDVLQMNDRDHERMEGKFIPAGAELPGKPSDPTFKPIIESMKVRDEKDQIVPLSSHEAAEFLSGSPDYIAMVYGQVKYSDFSGIHKLRFCQPIYLMRFGTTHHLTKNEEICFKYNHEDDRYTGMPKIDTNPAANITDLPPINCVKPSE